MSSNQSDAGGGSAPVRTFTRLERSNRVWLVSSLVLCLLSGLGASFIQTAGGSIDVEDMRWETPSGHRMSALLFKPETATIENPAPAIIVSHGWFNNREMQDLNYVELSRRGYVVVSIDMYGHGNSEAIPQQALFLRGIGMYDAVELVADLPYVDVSRIGVSGHSNGALAANLSVGDDDLAETPLISAVLLVDRDPVYKDAQTGAYGNVYGARDVGLIQDDYDEFFFRSYDAEGKVLTPPRDYLTTDNAQSFLHFGAAPDDFRDERRAGKVYRKVVDGREAIRVVYSLDQIHPWTHFSAAAARDQIRFFDEVFGAPSPIAAGSQVWQVRSAFTCAGLIGFAVFIVAFSRALLATRAFAGLRTVGETPASVGPMDAAGHVWFWGGMVGLAIVSGASYVLLFGIANATQPSWLPQGPPYFIGLWAAFNGLAALVLLTLSYQLDGKRNGLDLRKIGVLPGWRQLSLSALLAAIVVTAAFGLVFVVDYFFKTDFRIWVLAVKAFTVEKIGIALRYLPLFLVYFVANSIAINSFNRFTIGGKEWINTAVLALFNSLAPIVLVIAQYATFFQTGYTISWFPGIASIWLFPVVVFLAAAAVISRKIFRETGNPYVAGFINAAVVTMIAVSNTLTIAR